MENKKPRAYETFKIYNLIIRFTNCTEHKYGTFLSLDDAESCEFWVKKQGFGKDNEKVETKIETQSVRLPLIPELNPLIKKIKDEEVKAKNKRQSRGY